MEDRALEHMEPMNPQRVAYELSNRLPDRAILTADSGSSTTWWARQLKVREGMLASLSGTLATMGPGVPYAIAAKFAHPERPVVAFVGDGAFQMGGMNELITIQRYWQQWSNPQLVICVFVNEDLNMVTWEQRALGGDPKFDDSQTLPYAPFAQWAELLGLRGISCADDEQIGAAWDQALASDRPVVLECRVDRMVPPMPPHIRPEMAKKFTEAFLHGDPETLGILKRGGLQKLQEFKESLLPGRD